MLDKFISVLFHTTWISLVGMASFAAFWSNPVVYVSSFAVLTTVTLLFVRVVR